MSSAGMVGIAAVFDSVSDSVGLVAGPKLLGQGSAVVFVALRKVKEILCELIVSFIRAETEVSLGKPSPLVCRVVEVVTYEGSRGVAGCELPIFCAKEPIPPFPVIFRCCMFCKPGATPIGTPKPPHPEPLPRQKRISVHASIFKLSMRRTQFTIRQSARIRRRIPWSDILLVCETLHAPKRYRASTWNCTLIVSFCHS